MKKRTNFLIIFHININLSILSNLLFCKKYIKTSYNIINHNLKFQFLFTF